LILLRVLVQRVSESFVEVDSKIVGKIGKGMLLFVSFSSDDFGMEEKISWMAEKILKLRIFSDKEGKMNLSIMDILGEILVISQFTLYGNVKGQNRPSFVEALNPEIANEYYDRFVFALKKSGLKVESGIFGAKMKVFIENDGPVTLILEK